MDSLKPPRLHTNGFEPVQSHPFWIIPDWQLLDVSPLLPKIHANFLIHCDPVYDMNKVSIFLIQVFVYGLKAKIHTFPIPRLFHFKCMNKGAHVFIKQLVHVHCMYNASFTQNQLIRTEGSYKPYRIIAQYYFESLL